MKHFQQNISELFKALFHVNSESCVEESQLLAEKLHFVLWYIHVLNHKRTFGYSRAISLPCYD